MTETRPIREQLEERGMSAPVPSRHGMKVSAIKRTPFGEKKRASDNAEQRFQNVVEELATKKGWWHFHVTNPRTQTAGLPDLVLLRERVVWIELKATSLLTGRTGKLRPAQERVIGMLLAAGQEVHVLTDSSDDWEEVQRILE